MKRLMVLVLGLVFLFSTIAFATDAPAVPAAQDENAAIAAPVEEKAAREAKPEKKAKKKKARKKKAKKAKKEKTEEAALAAPAAPPAE